MFVSLWIYVTTISVYWTSSFSSFNSLNLMINYFENVFLFFLADSSSSSLSRFSSDVNNTNSIDFFLEKCWWREKEMESEREMFFLLSLGMFLVTKWHTHPNACTKWYYLSYTQLLLKNRAKFSLLFLLWLSNYLILSPVFSNISAAFIHCI